MLQDAIDTYHALLTADLAAESQAQLQIQQQRRGLLYGGRPVCAVLRPRFFTWEQYCYLQGRVQILLSAFSQLYQAAMERAALLDQLGLADWEKQLIRVDPGYRVPSLFSRFDAFLDPAGNNLKFIEYNGESIALLGYSDALLDVFYGLPIMRAFLRRYQIWPLPAQHNVMHALIEAYQQFAGRSAAPRIAILDWREVSSYAEFVLLEQYFRAQGLECIIADPREVEYRGGKLWAGDFHVTLIYKRVLLSELVGWGGVDSPILRAVRDGAVCMVEPFRSKILSKKASLAMLSDERNVDLFTAEQRQAIDAHIPWTRVVAERKTEYHGHQIDLLPYIVANKDRMVLKPNDGYGGKGIVLGWQADHATWEQAVRMALIEPYVVQERVALPVEPYPSLDDSRVQLIDFYLDTNPFVFSSDYTDGCLSRLSTKALLNLASGGSLTPTYLVAKR